MKTLKGRPPIGVILVTNGAAKAKRNLVLTSGGIGAAVALWHAMGKGDTVATLSIDYRQRHCVELSAASRIAMDFGGSVRHWQFDLPTVGVHLLGNTTTDMELEVPRCKWDADDARSARVPGLESVLISLAASLAKATGFDVVTIGSDAWSRSAGAIRDASQAAGMHVAAPLIKLPRPEVIKLGAKLGAPLSETWSCLEGGRWHCGRCPGCSGRRLAFIEADVTDDTKYLLAMAEAG